MPCTAPQIKINQMEFSTFVKYLDYGVLGLGAVILILSFILLSREQAREEFRPAVEKAIRRYMMLALVFMLVALLSTILEGLFVRPTKAEIAVDQEREEFLSLIAAKYMEEELAKLSNNENSNILNPIVAPVDSSSSGMTIEPGSEPRPTNEELEEREYKRLRKTAFLSFQHFGGDPEIFSDAVDHLAKDHPEIMKYKERLIADYTNLKTEREDWLEKSAIPGLKPPGQPVRPSAVVPLPSQFAVDARDPNNAEVRDVKVLEMELEVLKHRTGK